MTENNASENMLDVGMEDEAPEKTMEVVQDAEDDIELEKKFEKDTGSILQWNENDIGTFGVIGMIYGGTCAGIAEKIGKEVVWATMERPNQRRKFLNDLYKEQQAELKKQQAFDGKLAALAMQMEEQKNESKKTISSLLEEVSKLKAQTQDAAGEVRKAEGSKTTTREEREKDEKTREETLEQVRTSKGKRRTGASKKQTKTNAAAVARQKASGGKSA